jgi:cell division protein FtsL
MSSPKYASKRKTIKQQWQQNLLLSTIGMSLLLSSVGIVYVKHSTRQMFGELHQLQAARDQLNTEWTQLLLEQGTLTTDGRVDAIAHQALKMRTPKPRDMIWVKQ